jgi:hippurate hydrolase
VVIAARTVLALQTIVSRENNPFDPVVITVGTIHGGTKNSIIPGEVKLQLTVRTYKAEVRKRLLAAIERVAKGEAIAGAAPREPLVKVTPATNATYNDPELTKRLVAALRGVLGQTNVVEVEPTMVFEDFAEFNLAGIPSADFWSARLNQRNTPMPSNLAQTSRNSIRPRGILTICPLSKWRWRSKQRNCWSCWDTNMR